MSEHHVHYSEDMYDDGDSVDMGFNATTDGYDAPISEDYIGGNITGLECNFTITYSMMIGGLIPDKCD